MTRLVSHWSAPTNDNPRKHFLPKINARKRFLPFIYLNKQTFKKWKNREDPTPPSIKYHERVTFELPIIGSKITIFTLDQILREKFEGACSFLPKTVDLLDRTVTDTGRLLRVLTLVFREIYGALFFSSRVLVGLFGHISRSIWGNHDFSWKIFQDPLFLYPVLTDSLDSEPPEKTDCLFQKQKVL